MKAKGLILVVAAFFAIGNIANAVETSLTTTSSEIQQSQVVTAYYYSGGVRSVLIQIQNGYVVAYCSGTDYQGRQVWNSIEPEQIYRNDRGDSSTTSSEWYIFSGQKKYRAKFGQRTIYF